jgi:hypothetical protein
MSVFAYLRTKMYTYEREREKSNYNRFCMGTIMIYLISSSKVGLDKKKVSTISKNISCRNKKNHSYNKNIVVTPHIHSCIWYNETSIFL